MTILGAIIAGGHSLRFGGDKAAALLHGKALIEHVADGLRPQCDQLILCGRLWPGYAHIADRPAADLGPLGGLCAALYYAQQHGFEEIITAGCDMLPVLLIPAEAPAVIAGHYLFGRWPARLAQQLEKHLVTQPDHSMRHWIKVTQAAQIAASERLWNLNSPRDLNEYQISLECAA